MYTNSPKNTASVNLDEIKLSLAQYCAQLAKVKETADKAVDTANQAVEIASTPVVQEIPEVPVVSDQAIPDAVTKQDVQEMIADAMTGVVIGLPEQPAPEPVIEEKPSLVARILKLVRG